MPFRFKNTYNAKFTFSAIIDDPDQRYLDYPEFTVVTNPSEWKYWVHSKGFPEPYSFDQIHQKNSGNKIQYHFVLETQEEITILFKFLSFRKVDANLQFEIDAFDIAQQRGKDYIEKYLYTRHI